MECNTLLKSPNQELYKAKKKIINGPVQVKVSLVQVFTSLHDKIYKNHIQNHTQKHTGMRFKPMRNQIVFVDRFSG